jgi:asparagine synthetase B (glutamine-hydrolysing)
MGADEQLGGYGRHRKPHRDGTLREELDLDINRIWERNMGRDDRLLSDHGKEARFPCLDPNVIQFLAHVPVDDICDFTAEPGRGDNRILQLVAQRMQLTTASGLV